MDADFIYSTQQQHPQRHVNLTETQDTKKELRSKTVQTQPPTPKQMHKMGDCHFLVTGNQKNHQNFQIHRPQNRLQM